MATSLSVRLHQLRRRKVPKKEIAAAQHRDLSLRPVPLGFVGANGLNSSTQTPHLDQLATDGTNFSHAVTNQPVAASPSDHADPLYATETNVWRNGRSLRHDLPTLATELHKAGYSPNYIGKWHLAVESTSEGEIRKPSLPLIAAGQESGGGCQRPGAYLASI